MTTIAILHTTLLGLVEGITEFLPVSSTGHLIIVGHLLGFENAKAATFEIFIQLGAILAVVFLYKERFLGLFSFKKSDDFSGLRGLSLLALTTLPALFFGALTHGYIKTHLFNPFTVALGLGVGGILILLGERLLKPGQTSGLDALNWRQALAIGFFQCLALWPGVSRSAATIMGGMSVGVQRKTAAEYSFFAAVPVLCAAVVLDLYKSLPFLEKSDVPVFALGFIVAFISAWIAVKGFIRLLGNHTLSPFGWYRIAVALLIFWVLK